MRTLAVSRTGRPVATGFTLSELVVAMGLGGFVLALLLGFLGRLFVEESSLAGRLAIDRDLSEISAVMRTEIRRAVSPDGGRRFVRPREDCLLFRYRSAEGRVRDGGYRIRRGLIQRRTSVACRSTACATSCRRGRWVALNDAADWRTTRLAFRLRVIGTAGILVEIVIEGRRRHPPWITRRLDLRVLARG